MSRANLCRLCLNASNDYKQLYDDVEVYKITVKYFDPMFLNLKHHLTAICLLCWCRIVDFHIFQESVHQAQTKFVEDAETLDTVVVKSEILEGDDEKIKEEHGIDDSTDVVERSDFFTVPKLELMDVPDDNEFISDDDIPCRISVANETVLTTDPKGKASVNTNIQKELNEATKSVVAAKAVSSAVAINRSPKDRKTFRERDDFIAQWKQTLECNICHKSLRSFTLLQAHFRLDHPKKSFSVWCCRRFNSRVKYEEHIRVHIDPNAFKCELCGVSFKWKKTLDRHKCPQLQKTKDTT